MADPLMLSIDTKTQELLKYHDLFKTLIKSLILEETLKPIDLSDEQCKKCLSDYMAKNKIEDVIELKDYIKNHGMTLEGLTWRAELPARIHMYSQDNFMHKAEARFLEKKEFLDKVVYSLIRVKDIFLSKELYLRIEEGESSFGDLASTYSQGSESKTNGIVGPTALRNAHPILYEKLRTTAPGQLLHPFRIDDWWLIVRLERYEPARLTSATAQAMAQELFADWVEEQVLCKLGSI